MGEREGSSRSIGLTDSGRTPLAVLLGDTGELDRELDAALGRMRTDPEELEIDTALRVLDELQDRRSRAPRPPRERRHHASAITGRIQALAEEAFLLEEARHRPVEEPSGRHAVTPPPVVVEPRWQEEHVAQLPWALRQHLVKPEADRDRPFVLGAMLGAAVAVLTAITFVVAWTLSGREAPATAPAVAVAALPTQPGGVEEKGASSQDRGPSLGLSSSLPELSQLHGAAAPSPAAVSAPVAVQTPPPALVAAAAPRRPRKVSEVKLAPKQPTPAEAAPPGELNFDEGEAGESVVAAPEEPGPPPPSQQDLDDAFEREFGVGAAAAAAAPKRTVFVPPPVAALPKTLGESEILQTVIAHKAAVAGCVKAHAGAAEDKRTIVLSWVLQPGGEVTDVKVASEAHQGSPLGRCMVDAVRGWRFAPHGEAQPVRFPFSY